MGLSLDQVVLELAKQSRKESPSAAGLAQVSPQCASARAQDTSKRPITPKDAASAARDIVANLIAKWCDTGLPPLVLAQTLVDAGLVQITRERGPQAAAAILEEFRTT